MISIQKENELKNYIIKDDSLAEQPVYTFIYPCDDDYSDCFPFEIDFSPGIYFLECWGASGSTLFDNGITAEGGTGGYSSGIFIAQTSRKIYLYIGGSANLTIKDINDKTAPSLKNSFNGGTKGGENFLDGIGGGATDFRTKGGNWSSSLESRFLIAGGGGSARTRIDDYELVNFTGGDGGGINGSLGEAKSCFASYGTDAGSFTPECSDGTVRHHTGSFGIGASGSWAGGGGGYYGGGYISNGAGGGGSGYYGFLFSYDDFKATTNQSTHRGFGMAKITILSNDLKLKVLNSHKDKICHNIKDYSLFFTIFIKSISK